MRNLILLSLVSGFVCAVSAADLRWVNWNGDLKASTAANWEPEQVPAAGDNLTIYYDGSGTKNWHNDLEIEYGHITLALTNTSATRVDFDQKEVRVTDGFSVIGKGGTFYPRTAITGTGDFEIDCHGGAVYLPTPPGGGNVYSGNFIVRTGSFTPGAANVLGDETRHGYVYVYARSATTGQYGSLGFSGTWTMWNDIYYDNTSSIYALAPSSSVRYEGDFYFRGGSGTIQHGGGGNPICFYGKWIRWAPEGTAKDTSVLQLFGRNPGFVFYGGYEDDMAPMTIWSDASVRTKISSKVTLPYGIKLRGAGQASFGIDDVSDDPLPLSMANDSVVDLLGTSQKIGDITIASGATTASITDTVGGGEVVWTPSADGATFPSVFSGNLSLTLAAANGTAILGSTAISGCVGVRTGALVIDEGAALPNVTGWTVVKDATLEVRTSGTSKTGVLTLEQGGTLTIAAGKTLTVFKAYVNGSPTSLPPGDYTYGAGTLKVDTPVFVWTGAAGDGDLANGLNWNYQTVPGADDLVEFNTAGVQPLTGTLTAGSITFADGVTNVLASGAMLSAATYQFGAGSRVESDGGATLKITGEGSYADIPVSKGVTLRVADATVTFTSERIGEGYLRLEADDAESVVVATGVTVPVYTYKVADAYVAAGTVSSGAGSLAVQTKPSEPAATWSVWTGGAGADDKSIFTAGNWEGGVAPDLTTGNAKLRFPAGSSVAIASGVARAYALDFQGACEMTGAGKLAVGRGGAAVAGATVTFVNPIEFTEVPQDWNLDTKDAKVVFNGALGANEGLLDDGRVQFLGNDNAKVTKGIGLVEFAAACADEMNALVVVSNLITSVRNGAALDAVRGLDVWSKGYDYVKDPHLFACGLTVEFPVCFHGHAREMTDSTSQTAENWVVFNKPMRFVCDPDVPQGAGYIVNRRKIVFNAPVSFEGGNATISNCQSGPDSGVWFNDVARFSNRLYLSGRQAWMHFVKPGNTWEELLALNDQDIYVSLGAENVLDSRKQVLLYYPSGRLELNGHDQTITSFYVNFNVSAATTPVINSENEVAVLHLTSHSGNFPFAFTGHAGVEFMKSGVTVNATNGTSITRGPLIVTAGTVNFTGTGKWFGRGKEAVRIANGAKVSASVADTFGDAANGYKTRFEIAEGGTLELAVDQTAKSLVYAGQAMRPGVYGKVGGGAQYEIAGIKGDGRLTVTSVPAGGLALIIR